MPRNQDLQKHTLNLRKGDYQFIDELFHGNGVPAAVVIRQVISKFVDAQRAQLEKDENNV